MTLSNQIKAALIVAMIVAAGGSAVVIGTYLPWYILPSIVLVYMIYIMYQLVLTKLNTDDTVSNIK